MSFRNRCLLAGGNGILSLSIPIVGGRNLRAPIREVRLDDRSAWQRTHWRGIFSAYQRAPFFEYYAPELEVFYGKSYRYLFDWNLDLLGWLLPRLGFRGEWRVWDQPDSVESPGIELAWNRYDPRNYAELGKALPPYPQVFMERHGFLPNLSALDLLFCEGPSAKAYLQLPGTAFP